MARVCNRTVMLLRITWGLFRYYIQISSPYHKDYGFVLKSNICLSDNDRSNKIDHNPLFEINRRQPDNLSDGDMQHGLFFRLTGYMATTHPYAVRSLLK